MPTKNALIVAPEGEETDAFADYLAKRGFATEGAAGGPEALRLVQDSPRDIVLVDSDLPGLVLTDFVEAVLNARRTTRIVVVTKTARPSELRRAIEIGVACYAKKPFDGKTLSLQMESLYRDMLFLQMQSL